MENKRKFDNNSEVKSRKKRKLRYESLVLQDITNSSNSNSNSNSNSGAVSHFFLNQIKKHWRSQINFIQNEQACQLYFDIDTIGKNDPENCTIYARDIAGWLLKTEVTFHTS